MDKIIILGHENPDVDSIVSGYLLEKILKSKGYNAEFIIPDDRIEEETLNICRNNGLDPIKFKKNINLEDKEVKYILVDHNERDLSGEILCIIDHHPTSKEIEIKNYHNKKISSTACYICKGNEYLLTKKDLRLSIIATMVDTASFNSTKGIEEDKEWVINLCESYDFDYNELYEEGLCLTNINNIEKVSLNGLKKYNFNEKNVESSYVQIEDILVNEDKINQIIDVLKEYVRKKEVDYFVFIVHDMKSFKTMYYLLDENKIEKRYYDRYTSRGSTIMPEVEKKLLNKKSRLS